jgi:hypothetical protein
LEAVILVSTWKPDKLEEDDLRNIPILVTDVLLES